MAPVIAHWEKVVLGQAIANCEREAERIYGGSVNMAGEWANDKDKHAYVSMQVTVVELRRILDGYRYTPQEVHDIKRRHGDH